jgi:hypothetical protein
MKTRNGTIVSLIVSAFFVLLSVTFLIISIGEAKINSRGEGMSPMDFPRIMLGAIFIFAAIILIISIRETIKMKVSGKEQGEPVLNLRIIVGMVSIIVYIILWNIVGFSISTVLYIFGLAYFLNTTIKWWQGLLVAGGFTVLMDLVFVQLFAVMFPEPLWDIVWLLTNS